MSILRSLFVFSLALVVGCAGPRAAVEEPPPPPPAEAAYPAYETFDPASYPIVERAAVEDFVIEHDVPAELMAGTIVEMEDALEGSTVQGFRIQLFTSESKAAADAVRDHAVAWWREVQHLDEVAEAFEYGLHPVVVFGRPYFRVRVGIFAERAEAQPALAILRERYPEAFIVPDTITITRE